jgi:hypothetical protein
MDGRLELKIMEPLFMNRQKAVLDSIRADAEPYYPAEGKALLMMKYHWEPPPDAVDPTLAILDAERVTPELTPEEQEVTIIEFKNAPAWKAKEFAERLEWYPTGLWPRGETEDQVIEVLDMMTRDYLFIKAARDLGIDEEPAFVEAIKGRTLEMRVNYLYYNDIVGGYEPTEEEIAAYFEEYRDHYQAPPSYKLAFFGSKNTDVIQRLAEDWKQGMSYQDLRARYEAEDPGLETVGESTWIYEGDDEVRDSMVAPLKTGGVGDPVVEGDYAVVVKLIARRGTRLFTYDEIKDQVDEDAKTVLTDRKLNVFLEEHREKYGVRIHEEALRGLDLSELNATEGE